MKKSFFFVTGLAIVLAPVSASEINSRYQISGDEQASPVQAFDDGRSLYLQLNNPADPPAPIGPAGPVSYTIRGPYMILPIIPAFTLRFGPYQARVIASGASAPGVQDDGGVVSMTSPVDPGVRPILNQTGTNYPAQPVLPPPPQRGGVEGTITVIGRKGEVLSNSQVAMVKPQRSATEYSYSDVLPGDRFTGSLQYLLKADGTSAGARALIRAKGTCDKAKAQCRVEYFGAPSGKIKIEVQS
jgi:hypothetical protein